MRSVEKYGELGRFLTNEQGETPQIKLAEGLNQVIATSPYGLWKTAIREISSETAPGLLVLAVPVRGSDEMGQLIGADKARVILQTPLGFNADLSHLNIFVRDPEALRETWYHTDPSGRVTVDLVGDRTIVVFPYKGFAYTYALAKTCPPPPTNRVENLVAHSEDPSGTPCVPIKGGEVRLVIPLR